jgi:phosphoglycolate phosphatase
MATLIFDFDGTIADSLPVIMKIFHELTHTPPISEAEISRLRRLPLHDLARELHVAKWRMPLLVWRGRRVMKSRVSEVGIFADIHDVIEELHARGHTLMVMSSNETDTIKKFLKHNKLDTYFMQIYGGVGLFAKSKALKKIIHDNKINRDKCYYIGDEVRDIEAGLSARIKQIAVTWGYNDEQVLKVYYPTALVTSPKQLLRVIDK